VVVVVVVVAESSTALRLDDIDATAPLAVVFDVPGIVIAAIVANAPVAANAVPATDAVSLFSLRSARSRVCGLRFFVGSMTTTIPAGDPIRLREG
jgi:hypothetical protein